MPKIPIITVEQWGGCWFSRTMEKSL